MKVLTILGTRPEMIKLSETIKKFDSVFDHKWVHTGQNYDPGLHEVFYKDLDLRQADDYMHILDGSTAELTGDILAGTDEYLEKYEPDAVVILGDTTSSLAAISVKKAKIPLFHLEAGNRCFDDNVPEEVNRRIIDHIADVNIAYTEHARRNLLAEGLPADRTFVSGSPMREVINAHVDTFDYGDYPKVGFYVFSCHRDENTGENFPRVVKTLKALAKIKPVFVTVHPRVKGKFGRLPKNVFLEDAMGWKEYMRLQTGSDCVISDSGTLAEESAIMGFKAVHLRTVTERPEATEAGTMLLGGLDPETVIAAINAPRKGKVPAAYMVDDFSDRVAGIIQSYTPYIRRRVYGAV